MSPRIGRPLDRVVTLLALAALLVSPVFLAAQTHEYEVLILHPPGLDNSQAVRINPGTHEVVGYSWTQTPGDGRALLWSGAGTNVRALNPGTAHGSLGNGIGGSHVGGTVNTLGVPRSLQAWAWDTRSQNTTGLSLHPSGMDESAIFNAGGGQFVGWAGGQPTSWEQHAMLWTGGESNAVVDLHPGHLSYLISEASGIDVARLQQVGSGALITDISSEPSAGGASFDIKTERRALLWSGSAASVVDLHPSGFDSSQALAADDGHQVGYGTPTGGSDAHALLWEGRAGSAVDLHPAGFDASGAHGVRGGRQVGAGRGSTTGNEHHALLWLGRPGTVVDLHPFLPAGYVASTATDVDEHGNVVGSALTTQGEVHAVLWRRLPDLHSIWFQGGYVTQGGRYAELLVVLDGPATGDAFVELSSSNATVGTVPMRQTATGIFAGTIVPSGSATTVDGIRITPVVAETLVTITATYRGASVSATLTVVPAGLSSVSLSPAKVTCGQSSTGTVILDGPGGATVQLAGTTTMASWPGSVTVPANADRATFSVRTSWISPSANGTGSRTDTVTATYGGRSRQATLKCFR